MPNGVVEPSNGLHFHFAWWRFGSAKR